MFMRLLQLDFMLEAEEMLREFYKAKVLPKLQEMPGCRFAGLIQSRVRPNSVISMTLWQSKEDAEAYESSDVFQNIMKELEPYFSESSEWKIQLSQDLTLEYSPVREEPVIKSYTLLAQRTIKPPDQPEDTRMFARIVSNKIQKGKIEEFNEIYKREIIPELEAIDGCLCAYLLENIQEEDEVISVTMWESPEYAEQYEKSGQFDRLVEKVKHTFSQLTQWKMSLEKEKGKHAVTSNDISISHYSVVQRKRFE